MRLQAAGPRRLEEEEGREGLEGGEQGEAFTAQLHAELERELDQV